MQTVTTSYGTHTAILSPLTGDGLLLCPDPARDVEDPFQPFGESLHSAGLRRALLDLAASGWTPSDGDDYTGPNRDECAGLWLVSLIHDSSVDDEPDLGRMIETYAELVSEAHRWA